MSVSPPLQPPKTSPFREQLSRTPGQMWKLFGLLAIGTLVLWTVYFSGLNTARSSVQTVTKDSIPSIVAAQEIRQGLFQMDGDTVANYLKLTHGGQAIYDINADRLKLAKELVVAAQNITYGDAEANPIKEMVGRLPMYAELTSPALEGQGNWRARRLLMASNLLHSELVESANKLDKVNRDHLTTAYDGSESALRLRGNVEWIVGIALVAILCYIQFSIAMKSHRLINVPLAIATLLAIVIVLSNAPVMGREAKELRTAKEDAFDSVGFLSEAQADGADAWALAMYGLVPERKDQCWPACKVELANLAAGTDFEMARSYESGSKPTFKGLLGNELRNITFSGELEAANAELHAFAGLNETILGVESAEDSSGVTSAITQAFAPDKSIDSEFDHFDKSVQATKDINQRQFEMSRDRAFADLNVPAISLNVLALVVIVLGYFGIRQRVAEYDQ